MRIGIDCRLWNETGVGRYTRNLVSELSRIDHENEYVLFFLSKDVQSFSSGNTSFRHTVVIADVRWHTLEEQLFFPKILENEALDLMHFPYFSVPFMYARPFVVTIHDLIVHHFSTGQASSLPYPFYWVKLQAYRYIISHAARHAKRVIAVSNATKKEIQDHFLLGSEAITVTYEGIGQEIISDPRCVVTGKEKDYFLYVGNAYPHKNLDRLIDAFTALNGVPDLSLVLIGKDDFFYRRLRQRCRQNSRIVFKMQVSDQDLSCYYRHARALVMPSLMEGFGLTPLEAMVNRCPVLASDIPSLREICDNAAVYFNPMEGADMSEKMRLFLDGDLKTRERMKKLGEQRATGFTWEKMAKETLQIYKSSFS